MFLSIRRFRIKNKNLGREATTDEAQALLKMEGVLEKLSTMFEEAALDAAKNYQGKTDVASENSEEGIKKQAKKTATIDLSDDTDLSRLVEGVYGSTRYKMIANYILSVLGKDPITLSDGTVAIVDNRDASHIANSAWDSKTRHIAKIKDLVTQAELYAYENDVEHKKFDQFLYYQSMVRFNNEEFPLYLHVGRGFNDKKYHIYDITKKIRDTANRINGFERPKPNEGYAPKNGVSNKSISQSKPIVKNQMKKDSQGNKLSEEQIEFFKDSKVRDADGNLLVMYHGTPNAGFTKFKSGTYFTEHKWHADRYQSPGASSLSYKKTADSPDTYSVYLNIKKPFDTRNKAERDIFYNEYYQQWGTGTDLMESGLPDWLDGMDLQEFLEEMGYDYDGLILDEGGVGGYGEEVVSRGISYVVFDPAQVKNIDNKTPTDAPDIRYQKKKSSDNYSYESLISKPDMKVTTLSGTVPTNRADLVVQAKKNAAAIGRTDKYGGVYVRVDDIDTEVLLGRDGLKHSIDRRLDVNAPVVVKAGEIVRNSILINELTPQKPDAEASYVLIGTAKNTNGDLYIVRSVINRFSGELTSIDVLYAINAKKELAALNAPLFTGNPALGTNSTISIAQVLEIVNREFPDILPESVLKHFGHEFRPDGILGKSALFQMKKSSNRAILTEALESVAQNDIEKNKLAQYKEKIQNLDELTKKLAETRAEIKELSFAKGPRDTKQIRELQDEATKTANRINIYDRQLLNLEATTALKNVLEREKARVGNIFL